MLVLESTRRKAVMSVYETRGKAVPGGVLSASELRCGWGRTGLRGSDLHQALVEMMSRNLLRERRGPSDRCFEFTETASRAMDLRDEDVRVRVHDWITLLRARRRSRGTRPARQTASQGRRVGDLTDPGVRLH